jgi:hypothetical protein
MADFKKLQPALKIYQVHSATFESGILENSDVFKTTLRNKRRYRLANGITTSGSHQSEIIEAALKVKIENEDLFDSYPRIIF